VSVLVVLNETTDPLGLLEQPLLDAGLDLTVWSPKTEPPPPDVRELDGVVALGGATHPDEDATDPWLAGERTVLAAAVEHDLPVLGVCLGAQLLAQALGGTVRRLPAPRIGWYSMRPRAEADPLGWSQHVLEWHSCAFTLPPGAALLAGSAAAVQAFRAGSRAWGFQYHREAGSDEVADWIATYGPELSAAGVAPFALEAGLERFGDESAAHARTGGRAVAATVAVRA
jgi:GMP synthase (glutamine-hydrolysing)